MSTSQIRWPHAPPHWLFTEGIYFVTCGTLGKIHHFNTCERKDILLQLLLNVAAEFDWKLEAWAVLTNHDHFVARSPADPGKLSRMLGKIHGQSALKINQLDQTPGRKVWHNFRESLITFETSYLARLKYVKDNPVHHGLVEAAEDYPWCSASWFARNVSPAFCQTVDSFKTNEINVFDDF